MKTGVFGGTFNPVHKGHIMLAEYCMDSVGLDRIIMIPTAVPPHKISNNLASENDRLNMCKLACRGKENFFVSDIEIKRQGKSYTYETLTQLKEIYPDDHLYTIMGADMFLTLNRWKNPEIIFEKSSIITIPRDEENKHELENFYNKVLKAMGASSVILPNPVMSVSSTFIRENLDNFNLISNMLDKGVYDYIIKNNLYRK
ncbi:nicotinate-nucleotide adenylyltransferase [Ruminococcus bromii]|uniref:Probable nicotinate-nucleotide adenylyltransferase n=1 Tax=Ruminococcus bromii TaxID=40518 RepID=A0A2N0UJX5_9FIRM|nr:nicotinate-nucleotide adenylyltransferase [Ruminococcus bromii]PKD27280.1 putative nicotinate-nucleotide adenylyltransferase [Ruminococcus bromii]